MVRLMIMVGPLFCLCFAGFGVDKTDGLRVGKNGREDNNLFLILVLLLLFFSWAKMRVMESITLFSFFYLRDNFGFGWSFRD